MPVPLPACVCVCREGGYGKLLDEEEWTAAVRKLANWCFVRYKCDGEYRCRTADACTQALDLLFKQLLSQ